MVIDRIEAADVLADCRQTLGLSEPSETGQEPLDEILLAALVRRSAGIHCPCSRATLRSSLLESLMLLSEDEKTLEERIDVVIEGLIVVGDLLELNDVATDDPDVKGTWVFAAPPGFVSRGSGSIFLLGVVPDHDTFLPQSLVCRIHHEGLTRTIVPERDEDLVGDLRAHGMRELSERVWLKAPTAEEPHALLDRYTHELRLQPPSGTIVDLRVLDPVRPVTYYKGRWATAEKRTGIFVARRPQEYGAELWCLAELEAGAVVRILDLPLRKTRWRGCDVAWHLQMAIDSCLGTPQRYRRQDVGNGVRLDFFSPLPQWAERRLMILGSPADPDRSLMSYELPRAEIDREESFLKRELWLARED